MKRRLFCLNIVRLPGSSMTTLPPASTFSLRELRRLSNLLRASPADRAFGAVLAKPVAGGLPGKFGLTTTGLSTGPRFLSLSPKCFWKPGLFLSSALNLSPAGGVLENVLGALGEDFAPL